MMDAEERLKLEFAQIIKELKKLPKEGKSTGRKRALTFEMYKSFLFFYSQNESAEWSAVRCGWSKSSYYRALDSDTFREVVDYWKETNSVNADTNISRAIAGIPGRKEKRIIKDERGAEQVVEIDIPPVHGSVQVSQWYKEREDRKKKKVEETGGPIFKAPATENEERLMRQLLQEHQDYVDEKRNNSNG